MAVKWPPTLLTTFDCTSAAARRYHQLSLISGTVFLMIASNKRRGACSTVTRTRHYPQVVSPHDDSFGVENQWLGARSLDVKSHGGAPGPIVQAAASRRAVTTRSLVTSAGGPHQRMQLTPESSRKSDRFSGGFASGRASGTVPAMNKLAEAQAPPKNQFASSVAHGQSQQKRSRSTNWYVMWESNC